MEKRIGTNRITSELSLLQPEKHKPQHMHHNPIFPNYARNYCTMFNLLEPEFYI